MKSLKKIIRLLVICLLVYYGLREVDKFVYRHVEETRKNAPDVWSAAGYDIQGYEGYKGGLDGGQVWYIVTRRGLPYGPTYNGCLVYWRGEYHIYNLRSIEAAPPRR